jgi:hypothetical protein
METVLVYVGDWTTDFGWQQKQFIKETLNIPDGQEINPAIYQSHFFSLDNVDKLEQVYRGNDVEVHCFIRANPILLPAILNLTTGFKSVYSCHRCPDQGDTKLQKCPPRMGRYYSESADADVAIVHLDLGAKNV